MISLLERQLLHQFIIMELAIRALQVDFDQLAHLKLNLLYERWTQQLMRQLYPIYHEQKRLLGQHHIRLIHIKKIDLYFSEIRIATSGEVVTLQYSNHALKNEVEQFLVNLVSN